MTRTILHIDASARVQGSASRAMSSAIVNRLRGENPGATVIRRELSDMPLLDEATVFAFFTPKDARNDDQRAVHQRSIDLIEELRRADDIVIGAPIYNFGIPAPLKAWIDQIARAGETFKYSDTGPVGLLEGKRAYLAMASGGTAIGSDWDFAGRYLKHVLGFVGITDVTLVAADKMAMDADASLAGAMAEIDTLPAVA